MDFDQAIKAHAEWKLKLSNYIRKPDRSINAANIAMDNQCMLGKWLYGDGIKFAHLPEYQKLKEIHAKFHKAASSIIQKADSGVNVKEEIALGTDSEYTKTSTEITLLIMNMKRKVNEKAA